MKKTENNISTNSDSAFSRANSFADATNISTLVSNAKVYHVRNISLIVIFFTLIYTPFIIGLVEPDKKVSPVEKRALAILPLLPSDLKEINSYPQKLDAYYSDHFGFRDLMTKQYYKLQRSLDKDAFSKDVTKGKDGWLFLGQVTPGYKRFSDPIGDAMHVSRYTPEQLDAFIDYITTLQKWLKQKGIQYLFVIAPNKHTIYFEKLPDYIKKQNIESVTDQLVKALKDRTSIPVVDLRKSLLKAKGKYQLYYKTDSHWTHYAANIAQFEIMKRIQLMFPKRLTPKLYPDSFFSIFQKKDGDLCKLSKIVGISEKSPQPNFTGKDPVRKNIEENDKFFQTTCHSGNINAVIFRDSFFGYLVPYFSRKFNKTTFIWDMLSYEKLTKTLNKGKPDLVIEEWIERTLPYIPEEQTLFKKDL